MATKRFLLGLYWFTEFLQTSVSIRSSRFLPQFRFLWNNRNHLPLLRFLPAQTDRTACHSWPNFNKIFALYSGIILCSHLFTCFCANSTDFRSNCCAQVTSSFRSFRSLSSFKMSAPIGRFISISTELFNVLVLNIWNEGGLSFRSKYTII